MIEFVRSFEDHFRGGTVKPASALLLLACLATSRLAAQGQADRQALQGDWTLMSATRDGQTVPAPDGTRHVSGDTTTVTVNGQLFMRARFRLSPATVPRAIDYDVLEGPAAGAHQLGIYQLADSTLTFCIAGPGEPRPTEFASREGDGRTCSVWKRSPPH